MDVFVCTGMLTFTCIQHSHLDVCMIPTNKWPEGLTRKDVNLNDLGWLSRSEPRLAAAQSVPSSSAGLNWNHWAAADTHVCADVVQFGTCLILAYLSGTSLLPYQASPLARSQQGFFFLWDTNYVGSCGEAHYRCFLQVWSLYHMLASCLALLLVMI